MRLTRTLRSGSDRPPSMRAVVHAAGAAVGVGLALAVVAGFDWPASARPVALQLPKRSLKDNKQHLSSDQISALRAWGRRYQTCAVKRGVALDEPRVGKNEVIIRGAGGAAVTPKQFLRAFTCTARVGDPPELATFVVTADRQLHLYVPRSCLLPVISERS